MRRRRSPVLPLLAALLAGSAWVLAPPASAATSVLTKGGTLYEISQARLGELDPGAAPGTTSRSVLALRTTLPGGVQTVEVISGTEDDAFDVPGDLEFEESTGTIFVVYTKLLGIQSDIHFAVKAPNGWHEDSLVPSIGFYVSLDPRLLVTRQTYVDRDSAGNPVSKARSILHIVWWEDASQSQARYAAVFVEDGSLQLDSVVAWNLNEFDLVRGTTDSFGIPFSAYGYPSLHVDPVTNGGVKVSFANLVTKVNSIVSVTFPDDLTKLGPVPSGVSLPSWATAYARGHVPVGRHLRDDALVPIDTPAPVQTALSLGSVPTFYWSEAGQMRYVRADAPRVNGAPAIRSLRSDLAPERAEKLIREMASRD